MQLRPHQQTALKQVMHKLQTFGICYLAGEMRTGKTLVALHAASRIVKKGCILFITKLLAKPDIQNQINQSGLDLNIVLINYEQLHKINFIPSFIIYDEAHCLGMFPKPAKKTKIARLKFIGIPSLFLSGTPSPESYSQLFHQFWITGRGPWEAYKNFYKWVKDYVNVKSIYIGSGRPILDYSDAKPIVVEQFKQYKVAMTQEQAGFNGRIIEHIHAVETPEELKDIIHCLRKTRVYRPLDLIADTGTRLMSFLHQLYSGTVITNEGERIQLFDHKIQYIKTAFSRKRIAIFYCFVAEGDMLRKHFHCTSDPIEFANSKSLVFISQVVSGREGIDLSIADDLIFLNIPYSATSYFQAKARSQSINGGDKRVHWLFSVAGIENKIYNIILNKKVSYTLSHFKKDYEIKSNARKISA